MVIPDVTDSLQKLRKSGYKLVILSNGDRDMLKASRPQIGFKFDSFFIVGYRFFVLAKVFKGDP